ncbi:MAG: hypothetical protein HYZ20_06785 [Burkholderiales bacterium]|nr:hypothetical protein [Burkholderiales bacterium]
MRAQRDRLRQACAELDHEFWPDGISLRDPHRFDLDRLRGHNQITDAYLLALATARGGCLATFDQNVALAAVRGATPANLLLL